MKKNKLVVLLFIITAWSNLFCAYDCAYDDYDTIKQTISNNKLTEDEALLFNCTADIEEIKQAISRGVNINIKNKRKENSTPLSYLLFMTCHDHSALERLLIESGAEVHENNFMGWTLLHAIAQGKNPEFIPAIVSKGISINAKDIAGQTALHLAVKGCSDYMRANSYIKSREHLEEYRDEATRYYKRLEYYKNMIKIFVSNGADIYIKNDNGETVVDLAKYQEVKDLLISEKEKMDNLLRNSLTKDLIAFLPAGFTKDLASIISSYSIDNQIEESEESKSVRDKQRNSAEIMYLMTRAI